MEIEPKIQLNMPKKPSQILPEQICLKPKTAQYCIGLDLGFKIYSIDHAQPIGLAQISPI